MRPMRKQNFLPQISVNLLPGIISAAMVSVKVVMAIWTPLTVVPKSVAMLLIATFIVVAAKLHKNWASTSGKSISRARDVGTDPTGSTALAIRSLLRTNQQDKSAIPDSASLRK